MKNYGQLWYIYFSWPPKPCHLEFRQVNCTEEKMALRILYDPVCAIKRRDNSFQWSVIKIFFHLFCYNYCILLKDV